MITLILLLSALGLVSATDVSNNTIIITNSDTSSNNVIVNGEASYIEKQTNYVNNSNENNILYLNDSSNKDDNILTNKESNKCVVSDKLGDTSVTVTSFSDLSNKVSTANSGTYGVYTINLGANITATSAVTNWGRASGYTKLVINGNGYTITGSGTHRFMSINVNTNVTVKNTIFTKFNAPQGAIVHSSGNLSILNCSFISNIIAHTGTAGGVVWSSGILYVNDSYFYNNTANSAGDCDGGCIGISSGTFLITNCIARGNHANDEGGFAKFFGSQANGSFINCSFINNSAGTRGGVIEANTGSVNVNITNCFFINNTAGSEGGAIQIRASSNFIIRNCYFESNLAGTTSTNAFQVTSGSAIVTNNTLAGSNQTISGGSQSNNVVGMMVSVSNWLQLVQALSNIGSNSSTTAGIVYLSSSGVFNASSGLNFTSSVRVKRLVIFGNGVVLNGSNLYSFLRVGSVNVSISDVSLVDFVNGSGGLIGGVGNVSLSNVNVSNCSATKKRLNCSSFLYYIFIL